MINPEDMRAWIQRGELFLEYLPTIELNDRHCVGAEALVRWRRRQEVVSGGQFMPLVDNTPLSGVVTYWIIDAVSAELGEWLDAHTDAHISINVPPEILGRGGLEYAALRSGLKTRSDQIILEITERGVPDRLGLDALNLMAEHGVRVALDDTMLSGANLALLARCKFNIIKIDRELTAQLREGSEAPEWLAGLRMLLQSSTLQVIAEGVESDYQAQTLLAAGVQMAQGFFFSPPLSAPTFIQFHSAQQASAGTS